MSKIERIDGKQGGDQKVKITESTLKDIIKNEIKKYLKEISALGSGAVEGSPTGHLEGGDNEDESEDPTLKSKTKRGTKNVE